VLVELSVMEQRYQAVMAVTQDGWKVSEVAERLGVSRQAIHRWIARYEQGGLPSLADRSHQPQSCSHQITPEFEALISVSSADSTPDGDPAGSCISSPETGSTRCRSARASIAVSSATT
jgi:transposase-like protein